MLCLFFFSFFWEVGWVCSTFIYGDLIGLAIFHTLVEIYLVFKVCLSPYSCWGQTVYFLSNERGCDCCFSKILVTACYFATVFYYSLWRAVVAIATLHISAPFFASLSTSSLNLFLLWALTHLSSSSKFCIMLCSFFHSVRFGLGRPSLSKKLYCAHLFKLLFVVSMTYLESV